MYRQEFAAKHDSSFCPLTLFTKNEQRRTYQHVLTQENHKDIFSDGEPISALTVSCQEGLLR
jgi:hypothetical protein